jgi:hypothetical protein
VDRCSLATIVMGKVWPISGSFLRHASAARRTEDDLSMGNMGNGQASKGTGRDWCESNESAPGQL